MVMQVSLAMLGLTAHHGASLHVDPSCRSPHDQRSPPPLRLRCFGAMTCMSHCYHSTPKPEISAGTFGAKQTKSESRRIVTPSPTAGAENSPQSLNPQLRSSCGSLCFVQLSSLGRQCFKLVGTAHASESVRRHRSCGCCSGFAIAVGKTTWKMSALVTGSYRFNDILLEPGRTKVGRVALSPHS